MPSSPPSRQRWAAAPYAFTTRAMSCSSISFGKLRCSVSRMGEGPIVGSQFRGIGLAAASEMGDLAHERRPVGVDALRELPEVGDDLVDAEVELPDDVRRVGRDVR